MRFCFPRGGGFFGVLLWYMLTHLLRALQAEHSVDSIGRAPWCGQAKERAAQRSVLWHPLSSPGKQAETNLLACAELKDGSAHNGSRPTHQSRDETHRAFTGRHRD